MLNAPFPPWPFFDDEEREAVTQILSSGRVNYWTGQEGRAFETEAANCSETSYAIALANGILALDALGIGAGEPRIAEVSVRNVAFNGYFAWRGGNFSEDIVRLLVDDPQFDNKFRQYQFDDEHVFIRDVDVEPRVLRQSDLLL